MIYDDDIYRSIAVELYNATTAEGLTTADEREAIDAYMYSMAVCRDDFNWAMLSINQHMSLLNVLQKTYARAIEDGSGTTWAKDLRRMMVHVLGTAKDIIQKEQEICHD